MSSDEAEMEKKNARAEFAASLLPSVSRRWIYRHVFGLTDIEIAAIERENKKE